MIVIVNELSYEIPDLSIVDELNFVLSQALHFDLSDMEACRDKMIQDIGLENFRIVRFRKKILGGLAIYPMGQWFGGKSVRKAGIAWVGVRPEFRFKGVASFLFLNMFNELRDHYPISMLYPSNLQFYRKMGYDKGGSRFGYEISCRNLGSWPETKDMDMEPADLSDWRIFEQMYDEMASTCNGYLQRSPLLWKRKLSSRGKTLLAYIVKDCGTEAGYIIYRQPLQREPLNIVDVCALNVNAGRRIMTFIQGHWPLTSRVTWFGGANDLFFQMIPNREAIISSSYEWLLRILDVRMAIEARGYPPGFELGFSLEVADDLIKENNGKYHVEISGGRASVSEALHADLVIDMRGFASLYTGYLSPWDLYRLGHLKGKPGGLDNLSGVFSSYVPGTPDIY